MLLHELIQMAITFEILKTYRGFCIFYARDVFNLTAVLEGENVLRL